MGKYMENESLDIMVSAIVNKALEEYKQKLIYRTLKTCQNESNKNQSRKRDVFGRNGRTIQH